MNDLCFSHASPIQQFYSKIQIRKLTVLIS